MVFSDLYGCYYFYLTDSYSVCSDCSGCSGCYCFPVYSACYGSDCSCGDDFSSNFFPFLVHPVQSRTAAYLYLQYHFPDFGSDLVIYSGFDFYYENNYFSFYWDWSCYFYFLHPDLNPEDSAVDSASLPVWIPLVVDHGNNYVN